MAAITSLQAIHLKLGRRGSIRCGIAEPSGVPAPVGQKTRYKDGLAERVFMGLFARKMDKFGGSKKKKKKDETKEKEFWEYDYESFVEVSKGVMQGRSRAQQQEVVREVLLSMLPPGAPEQFRKLFPPTKWAAEFNAALTVPFFHWLVGPSQVIEVEVNGVKQRSGVRIKKCRYAVTTTCSCHVSKLSQTLLLLILLISKVSREQWVCRNVCEYVQDPNTRFLHQ